MMPTCTTPVPNVIFDMYLKELKSAELKVLLVVIRQTLGWADRRGMLGRKETDWISGSQLQQKTGSSKRAISSATETLVRKKLIEILDVQGNVLSTPEQRQGKTKLLYRIPQSVHYPVESIVENTFASAKYAEDISKKVTALVQKMQITKETLQN